MGTRHTIPFIYASIIAPVPEVIADQGGKADRPFREAGVPIELASEPQRILPIRSYLTLLEAAARETGDEHLGMSMAEYLRIEDLGPFGRLLTGEPSLRRAMETCNGLIHHYSSASRSWLEIEGETVRWHYQLTGPRDCGAGRRLDCEGSLLLFRTLVRLATGPTWQPSEILLEQATPHQLHSFQSRFGAPARCVGNGYALVFSRDLLELPMTYGKSLGKTDQLTLFNRLVSSAPDGSFVGSVKAIVRSQLCGGYSEMSAVSRSTGLSLRTFQRRLAENGTTYSELVADVRHELAQELLVDTSRSQLDISLSLGYSDAANFSRAFKQRTGVTPSEFRRSSVRSFAAA